MRKLEKTFNAACSLTSGFVSRTKIHWSLRSKNGDAILQNCSLKTGWGGGGGKLYPGGSPVSTELLWINCMQIWNFEPSCDKALHHSLVDALCYVQWVCPNLIPVQLRFSSATVALWTWVTDRRSRVSHCSTFQVYTAARTCGVTAPHSAAVGEVEAVSSDRRLRRRRRPQRPETRNSTHEIASILPVASLHIPPTCRPSFRVSAWRHLVATHRWRVRMRSVCPCWRQPISCSYIVATVNMNFFIYYVACI